MGGEETCGIHCQLRTAALLCKCDVTRENEKYLISYTNLPPCALPERGRWDEDTEDRPEQSWLLAKGGDN